MQAFRVLREIIFKTAIVTGIAVSAFFALSCSPDDGSSSGSVFVHPLASHFEQRYTDDLDGLLDRNMIRVLTVFSRTNFYLSGAEPYGFEYSLLKDYEAYLNKSIVHRDLKVELEFVPVTQDELIPALIGGRGDIAASGLTITPERLKLVDFTKPYLTGIDEVVVTSPGIDGVSSLDDLAGRSVFIKESSSYYESIQELNKNFADMGLPGIHIIKADETLEIEDILEMVNSGAIGITVVDSHIAEIWSEVFEDLRIHPDLKVREAGEIAWMLRKENPELKASLDGFLRYRKKGTRLGNIYFNRYFKENKWIKNPLSEKALAQRKNYETLFRTYADRYGFDWKLVMAMAYQESGLNNKKISRAGALGIMQVKPATASDLKVGIKDIQLLENNIHAGVKYLSHLRNRYFQDKNISEENRIRFCLAAYNAGPRKIRRARALARKMGLDPNVWFRNVEVAALRIIGQETVQYVSNVNKYYVLLCLAPEDGRQKMEPVGKGNASRQRQT